MNEVQKIAEEVKDECEKLAHDIAGGVSFGKKVIAGIKEAKADEPQIEAELNTFLEDAKVAEPLLVNSIDEKGLNIAADSEAFAVVKKLLADLAALGKTVGADIKAAEAAA